MASKHPEDNDKAVEKAKTTFGSDTLYGAASVIQYQQAQHPRLLEDQPDVFSTPSASVPTTVNNTVYEQLLPPTEIAAADRVRRQLNIVPSNDSAVSDRVFVTDLPSSHGSLQSDLDDTVADVKPPQKPPRLISKTEMDEIAELRRQLEKMRARCDAERAEKEQVLDLRQADQEKVGELERALQSVQVEVDVLRDQNDRKLFSGGYPRTPHVSSDPPSPWHSSGHRAKLKEEDLSLNKSFKEIASGLDLMSETAARIEKHLSSPKHEIPKHLLSKPEKFSEPTAMLSTDKFLERFDRFARDATNADKLEGLENFLDGLALAIYRAYIQQNPRCSYNEMTRHLGNRLDKLSAAEKSKSFIHRRQRSDESVTDYARDMELMMSSSNVPDRLQIDIFVNGLHESIRDVLIGLTFETLEQARDKAYERELVVAREDKDKLELQRLCDDIVQKHEATINMIQNSGHQSRRVTFDDEKKKEYSKPRSDSPYVKPPSRSTSKDKQQPRSRSNSGNRSRSRSPASFGKYFASAYRAYGRDKRSDSNRGRTSSKSPSRYKYQPPSDHQQQSTQSSN